MKILVLACALITTTLPAAAQLTATYQPQHPYIENSGSAQLVNFDIILTNATKNPLTLTLIQVSVLDSTGHLELRKFLSTNGGRPSIETIPNRVLPPESATLVFNPFFSFDLDLELSALKFDFEAESADHKQITKGTLTVKPEPYRAKTRMVSPLRGRFIVWDGHDFYSHHRRWDYLFPPIREFGFTTTTGRYSYDFIAVNGAGDMSSGDETKNESWLGFKQPVFSAGAGRVVASVDDRPDDHEIDMSALRKDLNAEFGNYIIIDHENGEFSLYGHIHQGSAKVKVGDRVSAGQQIAQVGASGSSLMPHLHFQVQTSAKGNAEGLPSYFHDFVRVRGAKVLQVKQGQVDSGEIVESNAK